MSQLLDNRITKEIVLPTANVTIEIYTDLLTGDVNRLRKEFTADEERGIETIRLYIKSWPFTDENDKPLPITVENLNKLPMQDTLAILNELEILSAEFDTKKKTS